MGLKRGSHAIYQSILCMEQGASVTKLSKIKLQSRPSSISIHLKVDGRDRSFIDEHKSIANSNAKLKFGHQFS
jgi:hypothetical protein